MIAIELKVRLRNKPPKIEKTASEGFAKNRCKIRFPMVFPSMPMPYIQPKKIKNSSPNPPGLKQILMIKIKAKISPTVTVIAPINQLSMGWVRKIIDTLVLEGLNRKRTMSDNAIIANI